MSLNKAERKKGFM